MGEREVKRYIELEAPKAGVVANDASEVVCYRSECDEGIKVDPTTLVLEDDDAVEVEAEEPGGGFLEMQLYCSPECRNQRYSTTATTENRTEN